jgi:1,5-anhydro-D-fructose reductase (1,5-anhydro-D-mannitol-forming)
MVAAGDRGIGWGVIGCGDVVDRKAGVALRTIPSSRIVTVMRRSADEAKQFAERHGVGQWTTNADEVIEHPDVNAIYIATPPENHLEYALAVCAAGKACLVEKPAGRSDLECRQMVDVFKQAGVPLYVSYYRRYLEKFRKVKDIVRNGELGAIVAIHYRMAKPYRESTWRADPKVSGGGHFYDLAGHVLDLFDDWFGPLELLGSAATNSIPVQCAEDSVALTFRAACGALGNASWNFAAATSVDELIIEGTFGNLRLAPMSRSGSVRMTLTPEAAVRASRSINQRVATIVKRRVSLPTRHHYRFAEETQPHRPMLEHIVAELRSGAPAASPEPALRTSAIMNAALDQYYGGRRDAFWNHPGRWQSLRNRAAQRIETCSGYRLTSEQVEFFETNGYLGPLKCDADWQRIVVPLKKGRNLHLTEPYVFDLCSHPSIVARAAQLMGEDHIALFKSRFIVKIDGSNAEVAWHQDVGPTNGGYFPDGQPVPTLTCWLALDRVNAANGAVRVMPGTHRKLYGDYHKRIRADLVERGDIAELDLDRAVTFTLEPGEFYFFHSWLLHGSEANKSKGRRAGVNMRYTKIGDEYEENAEYIPL